MYALITYLAEHRTMFFAFFLQTTMKSENFENAGSTSLETKCSIIV